MDDNFHRPYQTTPKRDGESVIGGDGLGADGAWEDSFVGTMGAGNGSYVKKSGTNASYAFMPQAALANYSAVVAGHQHSYAEALFELEPDQTDGYNFDVRARVATVSAGVKSYVAKLSWKLHPTGFDAPRLTIVRSDLTTPSPLVEDVAFVEFGADYADQTGGYYQYCSAASCRCWPEVQRAGTSSNPRPVRPAWLRIEVADRVIGQTTAPQVTASVGWGDGENPCIAGIDSCPYRCSVSSFDDSTRGLSFVTLLGRWGIDTHERNYRVYRFRAGNQ
jgi:hypothetical protein